jgi:hypothetical protein
LQAATEPGGAVAQPDEAASEITVAKKAVTTLAIVLVGTGFFALCLVSAIQLLKPRDMPFGVTGPSAVVSAIQHKDPEALALKHYSSQADLIGAAKRGDIYGGYIRGRSADTLVTVPAKSFFGEIYVRGAFGTAAKISRRPMTTTKIASLPTSDRTGAVAGLLTRAPQLAAASTRGRLSPVPHQLPTDRRDAGAKPWSVFVSEMKGPMRNSPGRAPMIPATPVAWAVVPPHDGPGSLRSIVMNGLLVSAPPPLSTMPTWTPEPSRVLPSARVAPTTSRDRFVSGPPRSSSP